MDKSDYTTRICSACLVEYPYTTDFFYRHKNNGGLRNTCKECWRKNRRSQKSISLDNIRIENIDLEKNGLKKCCYCHIIKPLTEDFFYFRSKSSGKYRPYCKNCHNVKYKPSEEYVKRQYAKHKNQRLNKNAAYREKNRITLRKKTKEYFAKHPEIYRAARQRRKARIRNLPYQWRAENEIFAMQYFNNSCAVCGEEDGFWHIIVMDHWIPISNDQSPGTVPWNMVQMCNILPNAPIGASYCNNSKNDKMPHEWLKEKLGENQAKRKIEEIEKFLDIARNTDYGI